jgi:hypothetical protein
MRRQDKFIISFLIVSILGWGIYEYHGYIQLQKEAAIEFNELRKKSFAEMSKPKGHLGFEGKTKKHVELRITNASNEITKWVVLGPSGVFASYGSYDAGKVTLELIRNGNVVDKLVFELLDDGNAKFEIYEDKIKAM